MLGCTAGVNCISGVIKGAGSFCGRPACLQAPCAADAPLSTSGSSKNLGRGENAPARADTPVKRLCAIPQKCLIPNLRIATLMNSRPCFQHQIRFSVLAPEDVPLPPLSPERDEGSVLAGRAGLAGHRDPCLLGARAAPPGERHPQAQAGWRLPGDNSTARNPTSDTPCSREALAKKPRAGFPAAGLSHQPLVRPQSRRLAAPWVASACRALLGFDFSWEFLRGTRLSWDGFR